MSEPDRDPSATGVDPPGTAAGDASPAPDAGALGGAPPLSPDGGLLRPPLAAASRAADEADIDRRRFFRQFATEMFHTAATVVGAATAIQRSSLEAASAILNPEQVAGTAASTTAGASRETPATTASADAPAGTAERGPASGPIAGHRSAFRMEGDRIVLVDQRRLPREVVTVDCRTAIDVANEIGDRTVVGGPALAQVAALGLGLSANRVRGSRPYARRAILRAAATSLTAASPSSRHLRAAVERVMARYVAIGDLDEDGDRIADAMAAEADAIVYEALDDHGRLVEAANGVLPDTPDRPLGILTLGVTGTLGGGQFGTALAVAQSAHHGGRLVHVYVLEGRPQLDGARVTAWELAQSGVPHEIVADAAAGWLLEAGHVDVVLLGSAAIAMDGELANDIGTHAVAAIATERGVPVVLCSPLAAVDPGAADGRALPGDERRAAEVLEFAKQRVATPDERARNPVVDVTPAAFITVIATEEGLLFPPFGPAIAAALESRARRLPGSLAGAPVDTPVPTGVDAPGDQP